MPLGSWHRYVGIAGILAMALLFAEAAVSAGLPFDIADPADKVASALISHRAGARSGGLFLMVAAIPLFMFAAGITDLLSREDTVSRVLRRGAFGFAITAVALFAAYQSVVGPLAVTAQGSPPETVSLVYWVSDGFVTEAVLFLGLFVSTTSILALVTQGLPPWVCWTGLAGGLCLTLGDVALQAGLPHRGLGALYVIAFYVCLAWILISSVWILLGRVSAQPRSA